MRPLRPPSPVPARDSRVRPGRSSVPVLPAETPAFWLRLGLLGLAMILGFMAWYLYVARKVSGPSLPSEIVVAPAPSAAQPANRIMPPASPSEQASAPAPAPKPAPTAMPTPPAAAASSGVPAKAAEPPSAPTTRTARSLRAEQIGDPSPAAVKRALTLAGADDDAGPPVTVGPGPRYNWAPEPSQQRDDPGPPIAIGPGPLYDSPRLPARTPSWPSNDSGPPIAIGPGPLVDYSSPGAGPR